MSLVREDLVRLGQLRLPVFIGAGASERRLRQIVVIHIEAAVEMSGARLLDQLERTLDYDAMRRRIISAVAERSFALIEALAQCVLTEVTLDAQVLWASIEVSKPEFLAGATPAVRIVGRRPTRVALGLGANLERPQHMLAMAVKRLAEIGEIDTVSSLYRTRPWGMADQPDFLNAALTLRTTLLPRGVLAALKYIERDLGRSYGARWGPRLIDIDLLDDDGARIAEADLIVPHPHLAERAFALVPLHEIEPQYAGWLARLSPAEQAGVERLAEWPSWCANLEAL